MKAKDAIGNESGYATAWTFTTLDATAPTGVALSSPTDAATAVAVAPTLSGSDASDPSTPIQYYFELATDAGFTTGLQNSGWVSGPSPSWNVTGLTELTTYYWHMKAKDAALNESGFTMARSFTTLDVTPPTVTLTAGASDPLNDTFSVSITFSESVTGFIVTDITVSNGTAINFSGTGAAYTVDIVPASSGLVTVDVAAGVAQDAAANTNTAATQLTRTADLTAPGVSVSSVETSPTNNSPFSVTVTFTEAVSGFSLTDITVGNGSAANLTTSDNITWTADIIPAGNGAVTVDIAAGVAADAVGNANTAASQYSIMYDGAQPAVVIASVVADPTNASPIGLTVTFSEAVTGFVAGDIAVGNGTVANLATGDSITWIADLTPSGNGLVTVNIAAGAASDAAGNANTAAVQFSVTYDGSAPSVAECSGPSMRPRRQPAPSSFPITPDTPRIIHRY